jgi:endogenous inhibitor of DNA gyrase (YacG/DUF329 family)
MIRYGNIRLHVEGLIKILSNGQT